MPGVRVNAQIQLNNTSNKPSLAKTPRSRKLTHPYISQGNVYLYISFIFSFYIAEFFSVPVGDSKETKTSSFPLTSVPSLDIKTLGRSSPILAKDKN